jgi:hypothetical protein
MTKKKDTTRNSKPAPAKEIHAPAFPQFEGMGMTVLQQKFVMAYCRPDVGFNGTRAYIEAAEMDEIEDYMTAAQSASRLLKNVKIQQAISIEIGRFAKNHDALAEAVLKSWAVTAFADVFDVIAVEGPFVVLRSVDDIPPHLRTMVQSVENTAMGIKVKFCDRDKAKENIARALGMFTETTRTVGESYETLVERLAKQEEKA